jgi:cytochrome o ubiquinol oxidase operon protein cyoD
MQNARALRTIGFVTSLILTLAAYSVIVHPEFFRLGTQPALFVIFTLAALQATVQFIFFLDVWRETGIRWNLGVFISTVLLIFVIVFFSIWIMDNLNYNMMPKN